MTDIYSLYQSIVYFVYLQGKPIASQRAIELRDLIQNRLPMLFVNNRVSNTRKLTCPQLRCAFS